MNTFNNLIGRHYHDEAEAAAEYRVLTEVEQREARRGLQRRVLVVLQTDIVLLQLVFFIVEVLR